MKIRNGFVSNSSSSSFVVLFDKKPESREEVKKVLNIDREDIVDQIWERSQICDGHVRTVDEIMEAELHQDWCSKKELEKTLTQEEADKINKELLDEQEDLVKIHKESLKEKKKWIREHLFSYIFHKSWRRNLRAIYSTPEPPKLWKAGDIYKTEAPWLNWFDHESFRMNAFPKEVAEAIVKAIDDYFEVPDKPYKVAVNMGGHHYDWDAGENADFSRIIYYTSESNMYALSNEEHPNNPVETLKERKERIEREFKELK